MPSIERDGMKLHYTESGSGDETVILSHSYLVDHRHFAAQSEALVAAGYRVVAYDHRDHGQSGRASAPYTLEDIVSDGVAIIEQLGNGPVHWVGLSTGGFVGMRIAARFPDRIKRLVLMDTSASSEPGMARLRYEGLLLALRFVGVKPLVGQANVSMFSRGFRTDPARASDLALWSDRIAANDPKALVRFGKAIFGRPDFLSQFSSIAAPTLIVVGEKDAATPVGAAKLMHKALPAARFEIVPGAGHLSTVENPEETSALLVEFLGSA
ncbi:MAG: alpha/beta fold hydrolase [Deltaproteobacteria bacterium]|nr:alpha/beta fold hydrolase [Deltaproteobacteria bacterium]